MEFPAHLIGAMSYGFESCVRSPHLYVGGDAPDELLPADTHPDLSRLWLQLHQLGPHVLGRSGEVADLGIRVEAEHLGRVDQGEQIDHVKVGVPGVEGIIRLAGEYI